MKNQPQNMNKSKRAIYRLDPVFKKFYVYCLYYSRNKKDTKYNKNHVFYVGKAKKPVILANRREREHIREAYKKESYNYHKSRKIRLLEKAGYFIMSKVLEESNCEKYTYSTERKWEKFFLKNGNSLTNMITCGTKSVGSGPNHPSFDQTLRRHSRNIIHLYTVGFWPIQKICRRFKLSQKTVKKILFEESNNKQRSKNLRSLVWSKQKEIIKYYLKNVSSNKLAKKYGCAATTIIKILKENNIKIMPQSPRKRSSKAWLVKNKIIKEFSAGKTKEYLCKKYRCDNKCTLQTILKEAGLI